MDLLQLINQQNNGLNDLVYVLALNQLSFADLGTYVAPERSLAYPAPVTQVVVPDLSDTLAPVYKTIAVRAYQSVLDVCVAEYGSLDKLDNLLLDNGLGYDSFLTPGASLQIRTADNRSKVTNTLTALQARISNYDRDLLSDTDIYLGTKEDDYIGPTTSAKIKVN